MVYIIKKNFSGRTGKNLQPNFISAVCNFSFDWRENVSKSLWVPKVIFIPLANWTAIQIKMYSKKQSGRRG